MHFSVGILAGERANLVAVEEEGNMGRRKVQAQVVISKVYILTHGSARRHRLQLYLQYRSVSGTKAHSHPSKHRHQRHEAPA